MLDFRSVPLLVLLLLATVHGAPSPADAPPERTMRPDQELGDRTTEADAAPEVLDACGAEVIRGVELPNIDKPWEPETANFSLQVGDDVVPYRLMSIFALPGEPVEIETVQADRASLFNACASDGVLTRLDADEWVWWPDKARGVVSLFVTETTSGSVMHLQILVLEPYAGEDRLDGFRFGRYETLPLRDDPRYDMPRGFFRVTPELADLWLTPHFQLRQFLCKQQGDYPKFVAIQTRLLLKLELLLERVNQRGVEASSFAVLSGFRTPHYNRAIGNKTRYSRHLYGDAADIYIDRDADGQMDDLDGDGRVTRADAEWMAAVIEASVETAWYRPFVGGLGIYGPKPHRGPFVHVDTRGSRARW